jgi:hypothetical protein
MYQYIRSVLKCIIRILLSSSLKYNHSKHQNSIRISNQILITDKWINNLQNSFILWKTEYNCKRINQQQPLFYHSIIWKVLNNFEYFCIDKLIKFLFRQKQKVNWHKIKDSNWCFVDQW